MLSSGLYETLVGTGWLVPHAVLDEELAPGPGAYRILRPDRIPFVSYPYEWCSGSSRCSRDDAGHPGAGPRPRHVVAGRQRLHHPVPRRASPADRHAVVRRPRSLEVPRRGGRRARLLSERYREGAPGRLPAVLRALPGPLALAAYGDVRLARWWHPPAPTARDEFTDRNVAAFESAFTSRFHLERREPIEDSQRTLYLIRRHDDASVPG
ncbi:MAG: hypothetical protein M3133_05105 [Actinomycetota bacterium]|nr:hypothetical protein [Actinomycetota bacterium]